MAFQRIGTSVVVVGLVLFGVQPVEAQSKAATDELKIKIEKLAERAAKVRVDAQVMVAKIHPEINAMAKELARTSAKLGVDAAMLAGPQLDDLKIRLEEAAKRLRTLGGAEAQASPLAGFSVVLVQGDLKGASTAEGVPAAAAKALADLKDFLPYKSYQLLDTQWILGNSRVVGRLQGAGRTFELHLTAPTITASGVTVSRFVLRDQSAAEADRAKVAVQADQLRAATAEARKAAEAARAATAQAARSGDEARRSTDEARAARTVTIAVPSVVIKQTAAGTVIDTSFTMAIGETVVVGTSKLSGASSDQALIVLLTAVGK